MTADRRGSAADASGSFPATPRLGIAGFGRLARGYYVPALGELGGIHPAAVADPLDASRAAARAAFPAARTYASAEEMLGAEALDGLLVASPPSAHLDAWRRASAAGVAVFMEKPFLLVHELAGLDLPTQPGSAVMVDFNRRFWSTYRRLAERVARGDVGAVARAELRLEVDVGRWSGVTAHRFSPDEGGALHDLGSHLLDLAWMLFGREPLRVRAQAESRRWARDHVRATLDLPDGITVDLALGYGARTREQVAVHGSRGTIRLHEPNGFLHLQPAGSRAWTPLDRAEDAAALLFRGVLRGRSLLRHSIRGALAEFLSALAQGRPPAPGLDDALRNAAWLDAVSRAIDTGLPTTPLHPSAPRP